MMRRHALLGSSLLATLALAACATDQLAAPTSPSASIAADASALLSLDTGEELAATLASESAFGDIADVTATDLAAAVDPKAVCNPSTDAPAWLGREITKVKADTADYRRFGFVVNSLAATTVVMYEPLLFQTPETPQYFGRNGEHTHTIGKTERDLNRFWAMESAGVQVVGMHGDVLLDLDRLTKTYQKLLVPTSVALAPVFAKMLRDSVAKSALLDGGNHPYFTFNAVAAPKGFFPANKIAVGDGVLAGYDALGYSDVAPTAIFAHEFAHQVQFAKGIGLAAPTPPATEPRAAERTRYNELGADFMAAYFLTHARGAALNQKRVAEFLAVFYGVGDCSFTSSGHHGTPAQRMASAQAGFALADQAQKQGHIMTPEQVQAAFVAALPNILTAGDPYYTPPAPKG